MVSESFCTFTFLCTFTVFRVQGKGKKYVYIYVRITNKKKKDNFSQSQSPGTDLKNKYFHIYKRPLKKGGYIFYYMYLSN